MAMESILFKAEYVAQYKAVDNNSLRMYVAATYVLYTLLLLRVGTTV